MIKTIYFLLLGSFLFAQPSGSINGRIIDAKTKQPLPSVNIIIPGSDYGAATDIDGKYSITGLAPGIYQLRASAIGFITITKTDVIVSTARPAIVDFELSETQIELEGITVTSGYFQRNPIEVNSIRTFSYEEIRRAPGGFEDVVRALSILPGVAQADAGRNDLIVRGGAPSENLYIVDGIVAQNINHFGSQGATGGPLSFINLDFVKETSFSTGGFSSQYGDKLSSVLSIDLREGRNDRIGGKATISATQFGLNAEGPIGSNANFIFSARRSYLDLIFKAAGFSFVPEYYDVLTKINYNIDNNNSLSYLFIGAFDNVRYFNETADQRYDNTRALGSDQQQYITGLSFRHLFQDGFLTLSLSRNFTDYDTQQRDSLLNTIFKNVSREGENILRGDVVYKLSPSSEINTGFIGKLIRFSADVKIPGFFTTFGDTLTVNSLTSNNIYSKFGFYTTYSTLLGNRIRLNTGLRADYFNAINERWSVSPRFSLSYLLTETTTFNLSTGIYHQSPSYIWLTADEKNKNLKQVRVDQYIAGIDQLLRSDLNLKVEAFYKNYKNYPASLLRPYLVLANTGAGFAGADDNFSAFGLEPLVSEGKGDVRGIELSLQKKSSDIPHYGIFSLTYSESFFTPLDGVRRVGSYDQKWILNLSAGYIFNDRWEVSMKFRFATGKPYTPFNSDGTQSVLNYNTSRLEPVHSLDLRIDRRWNFDGWNLITYLDIQNVYNRTNVFFVRWDARTQAVAEPSSIGILPTIGISVEF